MVGRSNEGVAWQTGRIELSDGFLAYHRLTGRGPPLVLSHGLTDSGLCWRRVAEALAHDFDIVALDARGHGGSSPMPDDATHSPSRDIAEAIEALRLSAPIVMGHSVGALAVAGYVASHQGGAARVILEDPPLTAPAEPAEAERRRGRFRKQVEQLRAMTEEQLSALARSLHADWSDEDYPDWIAAKKQVDPNAMPALSQDWRPILAAISAPTLLIRGDSGRGGIVTAAVAEEAMALNPNIRAVHVPGAAHNIRRENFPAFLSAVRGFLADT